MARSLYPADTGGKIRSSKLFERLSRRHAISILCFRDADATPEALDEMRACCAHLETIPWNEAAKFTPRFYAALGASLFSPLPFTVRKYKHDAMRRRIHELAATGAYDLLVCDFLQPSINCLDLAVVPKVLFEHNVEAVIRRRHAEQAAHPIARAYLSHEARKLARYERRAALAFDHCIMVSGEDCQTMAREYGVRHTSAIPTGVDAEYFQPGWVEAREPELVFVGSMDWLPNQDAVVHFVRTILPRIRQDIPARLVIAGRNPPDSIRRLADGDTVRVTGTVADVRPLIGAAQVVVVPLRIGGGTRIKIFEALAMAKPVVSTTIGAEGLPVTHGSDILLADDPADFAAAVVDLLRSRDARTRLGDAGRRLVVSGFTWDAAAERFSDICTRVVQQRGRRAS